MRQAVGEQQQWGANCLVVSRYLPGGGGGDGHGGRLALHQQQGLAGVVEGQQVGALLAAVVAQAALEGQQAARVAQVVGQVVHHVLAHPLLGREHHVPPPQRIPNQGLVRGRLRKFGVERRQVQGLHHLQRYEPVQ